jgi:hypothetical protein
MINRYYRLIDIENTVNNFYLSIQIVQLKYKIYLLYTILFHTHLPMKVTIIKVDQVRKGNKI